MLKMMWAGSFMVLLGGCQLAVAGVDGSGVRKDDRRTLTGFTSVEVHNALTADIVAGAAFEVVVSGDDNLLPLVRTQVKGDRLVVSTDKGLEPKAGLRISIKLPALNGLDASGASRVTAKGVTGAKLSLDVSGASQVNISGQLDSLAADISGASQVELTGRARSVSADISGASRVAAPGLEVESAQVDVSGASRVELKAQKTVNGEASGASTVLVGGPAALNVESSGASSVKRR